MAWGVGCVIGAFFWGLCDVRWRYKTPCFWVAGCARGPKQPTKHAQQINDTKQEKSFTQQYSHMYTHRLRAMRPLLETAAQAKWGGEFPVVSFLFGFNGSLGRVWVED